MEKMCLKKISQLLKIGIGLTLKSFHCNKTLSNNNNKTAQFYVYHFLIWLTHSKKKKKKSRLMLLNHRKMKAVPAINEML